MKNQYRERLIEHYDPGDHRPHGSRFNNIGGKFLARERGAFLTPSCSKRDMPYHVFLAVLEGRLPLAKGHGSKLLDGLDPIK